MHSGNNDDTHLCEYYAKIMQTHKFPFFLPFISFLYEAARSARNEEICYHNITTARLHLTPSLTLLIRAQYRKIFSHKMEEKKWSMSRRKEIV